MRRGWGERRWAIMGIAAAVLGGGATLASVIGAGAVVGGGAGPDQALIEEALQAPLPTDPGSHVGGAALERQVFADGHVTFDEYERAVLSAIQCVRDQGFTVVGPYRYPEGPLVYSPGEDPSYRLTYGVIDTADEPRQGEVLARCEAQWLYRIQYVWLGKHAPTAAETQAWLERAWACARARGVPLSEPPTEDDAMDAVAAGCRPWETTPSP